MTYVLTIVGGLVGMAVSVVVVGLFGRDWAFAPQALAGGGFALLGICAAHWLAEKWGI